MRLNLKIKVQSRTREEAVVLVAARRESEAEAVAESLLGAGGGAAGEGGDGEHVPHGGAVVLVASPLLRVAPATTLSSGQQYVDMCDGYIYIIYNYATIYQPNLRKPLIFIFPHQANATANLFVVYLESGSG